MRRRLRSLLGLVLFLALVGWPGLALAVVALLVIATLPVGAR